MRRTNEASLENSEQQSVLCKRNATLNDAGRAQSASTN